MLSKRKEMVKKIITQDNALIHNVHTPYELTSKIVSNVFQSKAQYLVFFNLEFVLTLIEDFGVKPSYITIYANDDIVKKLAYKLSIKYVDNIEELKTMKFNNILGNPPFQKDKRGTGAKLWIEFIELAFDICKENGNVSMITPTNFVYRYHKSHKILFQNNVLEISLDAQKHFNGIGESIGYFVAKKQTPKNNTVLTTFDNESFAYDQTKIMVPKGLNSTVMSILNKTFDRKVFEVVKEPVKNVVEEKTKTHKFEVINHIWGSLWSDVQPEYIKSKVLLSRLLKRTKRNRTMVSFPDISGKKNIQDGFTILTENPENVSWLISESKLMKMLSGFFDKSQYLSPELKNSIPKIEHINNDEELYSFLNLTQEEIDYVEQNS